MSSAGRLQALGDHVAREEEPLLDDEAEHQRLRAALLARAPFERRGFRLISGIAGIAAAAALLGSVWFWRRAPEQPLRFFVGPGHVQGILGEFVSAVDAPVPVTFSDGTKVVFAESQRLAASEIGSHYLSVRSENRHSDGRAVENRAEALFALCQCFDRVVAIRNVQGTANQAYHASLRVAKGTLGGKISPSHSFDCCFFLVSFDDA